MLTDKGVTLVDTWRALERRIVDGRCKSIGLSDITLEKNYAEGCCGCADQAGRRAGRIASVSSRMGAARVLPAPQDCCAGVCGIGTCHGAKCIERSRDHSDRTACEQDTGSSCPGVGSATWHGFPDDLDQASSHSRELRYFGSARRRDTRDSGAHHDERQVQLGCGDGRTRLYSPSFLNRI